MASYLCFRSTGLARRAILTLHKGEWTSLGAEPVALRRRREEILVETAHGRTVEPAMRGAAAGLGLGLGSPRDGDGAVRSVS